MLNKTISYTSNFFQFLSCILFKENDNLRNRVSFLSHKKKCFSFSLFSISFSINKLDLFYLKLTVVFIIIQNQQKLKGKFLLIFLSYKKIVYFTRKYYS